GPLIAPISTRATHPFVLNMSRLMSAQFWASQRHTPVNARKNYAFAPPLACNEDAFGLHRSGLSFPLANRTNPNWKTFQRLARATTPRKNLRARCSFRQTNLPGAAVRKFRSVEI